jgi:hypothetical protein
MDQEYRMTRVNKILEQLNYDHNESKKQEQKHKSKGSSLDKVDYMLTAVIMITGMSCLSTVVSPVVGSLAGICGIASVVIKTIHKINSIKTQKWYDMCELIDDTHSKITLVVSNALDNNCITDFEMKDVIVIYDTYRDKLTLLKNEYLTLEKSIKLKN